jgi:hypothetical protein
MNEQIKGVMQGALLSTSKKREIELRFLSIEMSIDELGGGVLCNILNKEESVGDISWREILGIKFMAFSGMIVSQVSGKIITLADANNIPIKNVKVRVYAISNLKNAEPKLHLFNKNIPVKGLNIKELV